MYRNVVTETARRNGSDRNDQTVKSCSALKHICKKSADTDSVCDSSHSPSQSISDKCVGSCT